MRLRSENHAPQAPDARPRAQAPKHRRWLPGLLSHGFAIALIVIWAFTLRPQSLGGPAGYVMVRGTSMLPTYHTGDLVIAHERSAYAKGEIIAYRVPKGDLGAGLIVIHRIIGGSPQKGFITKGDNNKDADDWRPKLRDIVGSPWIVGPHVGRLYLFLMAPLPLASLAAGIAVACTIGPKKRKRGMAPVPLELPLTVEQVEQWSGAGPSFPMTADQTEQWLARSAASGDQVRDQSLPLRFRRKQVPVHP